MAWTGLSHSFTLWRCALQSGEARLSTRGIPLTPTESEQHDTQREVQSCKAPGRVLLQGHLASTFVVFGTRSENKTLLVLWRESLSPHLATLFLYVILSYQNRCQSWKYSLCEEDESGKSACFLLWLSSRSSGHCQRQEPRLVQPFLWVSIASLYLHLLAGTKGEEKHLYSAAVTVTKILLLSARANADVRRGWNDSIREHL